MKVLESLAFFARYVRNPSSVGAICPSSRFLARKMVAPLKHIVEEDSVVVELGSGTGAVTKYILSDLGITPDKLFCIEFDKTSVDVLSEKFPQVNIANDSAENMINILGGELKNLKCVVSCLPILSLPEDCGARIIECVEKALPEGGMFVQFTYNLANSSVGKFMKELKHVKTSYTMLNIPPARIDFYVK
ncbi:MAG: hypothetical protein E7035_09230 [Verrucomicrobiaceae bacterium]|nr:hypothetical protein [Verrucomicrobiaceae bacterium]